MNKKFFFLLFMTMVVIIAGCGNKTTEQGSSSTAAGVPKITIGTDASFPPFESMSPTGQPEGFDVDVINAIAASQGMDIEVKHTGWDGMMSGLENGTVQIGIAGITITDERKKAMDFTAPYFTAKQVILVKNENSSVTKVADLKGKKIGVQSGTTGAFLIEDTLGKGYSGMKGYKEIAGAIEDLQNGRIDAVVADNAVINKFVHQFNLDKVKIIEDKTVQPERYGITVKKGNKELLTKLDKGLAAIKANGKYDELYKKYFSK